MTTTDPQPDVEAKNSMQAKYFRKALNDLTPNNVGQLKALNEVIFTEKQSDDFYKDAVKSEEFAKLALFNDICVGGITTTKETVEGSDKTKVVITTLGVLNAYRRMGLGAMLLDHIITQSEEAKDKAISEIHVNLQTKDEGVLAFFKGRGFAAKGSSGALVRLINAPVSA
ncbi:hypothetical protein PhCBS80983_g00687 [Powellomyces hirtus]|uniref:N-acetyltransferase domain-containing protein n=1 Tax=Powellomyces hirtus TaxID=109895 RepID=A0A507EEA5_9FUNG|nr:hypothetical protein DFJ77DRAFT_472359 [Powellomyces hirtus]TPX62102.1 hypothetical protein PhCBS80983_g00687 [Powellomyces hirtus]